MTTNRPTPAQDALAAAEAEFTLTIEDFIPQFESLTRDEAVEQARAAYPYSRPSKISTKAEAVRMLARDAFNASPEKQALNDLMRAADREEYLYEAIDQSKRGAEFLKARLVEEASGEMWATEKVIDAATSLRTAVRKMNIWNMVEGAAQQDGDPAAALLKVRVLVTGRVLSPYAHKATSRSTSVVANLCSDIDVEADAIWLDESKAFLPKR